MNGLKKIGTFSYPPSSQLFESAECFNFRFFPFHKKLFCIIFGLLNIGRCFVVISDRWTILEIAKYSKLRLFLYSLGSSYAIALEGFRFLRYDLENSLHVLIFIMEIVQQSFSKFVSFFCLFV